MVVNCHRPTCQSPQGYPHNFSLPVLISCYHSTHGSFLGLLAGLPIVGLHPQACKPCGCPGSRPKIEPRDSIRDINGLMSQTYNTKDPGATFHQVWQITGRTWLQSSLFREGGYTLQGGLTTSWSSVTRETSSWGRGQAHRQLLIKPSDSEDWIVM